MCKVLYSIPKYFITAKQRTGGYVVLFFAVVCRGPGKVRADCFGCVQADAKCRRVDFRVRTGSAGM